MGTSWSREAAALLACDVEEPQEPSSKDIDYDQFFKDLDELREVRKLYDAVETGLTQEYQDLFPVSYTHLTLPTKA